MTAWSSLNTAPVDAVMQEGAAAPSAYFNISHMTLYLNATNLSFDMCQRI